MSPLPDDSVKSGTYAVDDPRAQLRRQSRELTILARVREDLSQSDDVHVIIRNATESLSTNVGYSHVSSYLILPDGLRLIHQVGAEHAPRWMGANMGVRGRVAREGRGTLITNVAGEPDYIPVDPEVTSVICVPFGLGSDSAGLLYIEITGEETPTETDFKIVSEIAGLLTLAIERAGTALAQRYAEHRLQMAMEAAAMGVWTWNTRSGDLDWNFAIDDPAGIEDSIASLDDLLARAYAGDFGYLEHTFSRAAVDGEVDVEFRITTALGVTRWLNLRGQAVEHYADGEPRRIAGVVMDVTGRKRLEEERIRLVHLETARANAEDAQRVLETMIERLTDGYVAVDAEMRITTLNEQAASLFVRSKDELLGSPLASALELLGDQRTAANIVHACSGGEPNAFDVLDSLANRFLEVRVFPGVDGTTLHIRDVTALRRAEYERQRSEARFRSLVQQASDLILILDRQAVVQFASPAVKRMLGFDPDEITGRVNSLTVHPADVKRFRRALIRVLRIPGLHPPFEIRVQHRDGSYRWLEITPTNLLADPLMHGVVANCRDITERHASEFNLWMLSEVSTVMGTSLDLDQTLEALTRLLVTYTSDLGIVAVFNDRGEIERFGSAQRAPRRRTQLDGRKLAGHAVEAIGIRSGRTLSSRHTIMVDVANVDQFEETSPYLPLGRAMRDLSMKTAIVVPIVLRGQVSGLLLVGFASDGEVEPAKISMVEDVARRAALGIENAGLYLQARNAIEARDRFLSVAAHELRTPITSVTGYTRMLRRELSERRDPDRIERYVSRLDEAGMRLNALAEDLLDVSRIRTGLVPMRTGPVELGALAHRVAMQYAEHRSSARDRITVRGADDGAIVLADPDRLEQVLTNLIDNSLKYSPPTSKIEIISSHDADHARVVVADHGIGVAPENLEAIFQPFGRAEEAEARGVPGLGLGLYICRSIIERLGGSIWAESGGPNTGLAVVVQMPVLSGDAGQLATERS
jgi:PAS domain S-box-containing protein